MTGYEHFDQVRFLSKLFFSSLDSFGQRHRLRLDDFDSFPNPCTFFCALIYVFVSLLCHVLILFF